MRTGKNQGQEGAESDMLRLAMGYFERVLRELDATLDALEAHDGAASAQAKGQVVDVRKAIQTVFEERHRLDKIIDTGARERHGGGLDLDAARLEIGRRLDRLRSAGAAGGIPGGAE